MTKILEIPNFLKRDKSCVTGENTALDQSKATASVSHYTPSYQVEYGKHKLTRKFKENLAILIRSEVSKGNNTFGKIRKALGERYSDNELRCGINQAKKWNKSLALRKIIYWKLIMDGKTYSVLVK